MPDAKILQADEPSAIIPDGADDDVGYNIAHVEGGSVHLSHNKRDVVRNPTDVMERNDRVKIGNHRGNAVWAYAPKGAKIRMSKRGFSLDFLTRRVVERPEDKASSEGNIEQHAPIIQSVASGGSKTVDSLIEKTGNAVLSSIGAVEVTGAYDENVIINVAIEDESGATQNAFRHHLGQLPFNFRPNFPIPENGAVKLGADNESPNTVTVLPNVVSRYGGDN